MKILGRRIVFGLMVCAAIGVLTLAIFSRTQKVVADQKESGQWVDPANPPVRACVEARLSAPGLLVEIMVTATR